MELRKAVKTDAEMVGRVLVSSYNISDIQEGIRVFHEETEKKFNYVVAEESTVVGIASWVAHGLPKHGLCEMDRLAVLPGYRSRGIAKKLFSFLVENAKGFYVSNNSRLRKLYLLTHAANGNAQELYKKLGFSYEAAFTDHYYDGVNELVFSMFFGREKHHESIQDECDFPCVPVWAGL